MAFEVSNNNNKRVSIGYSYMIPIDERIDDRLQKIKIVSFKNNDKREETTYGYPYFTPLNLANTVVKKHNELETSKIKILK